LKFEGEEDMARNPLEKFHDELKKAEEDQKVTEIAPASSGKKKKPKKGCKGKAQIGLGTKNIVENRLGAYFGYVFAEDMHKKRYLVYLSSKAADMERRDKAGKDEQILLVGRGNVDYGNGRADRKLMRSNDSLQLDDNKVQDEGTLDKVNQGVEESNKKIDSAGDAPMSAGMEGVNKSTKDKRAPWMPPQSYLDSINAFVEETGGINMKRRNYPDEHSVSHFEDGVDYPNIRWHPDFSEYYVEDTQPIRRKVASELGEEEDDDKGNFDRDPRVARSKSYNFKYSGYETETETEADSDDESSAKYKLDTSKFEKPEMKLLTKRLMFRERQRVMNESRFPRTPFHLCAKGGQPPPGRSQGTLRCQPIGPFYDCPIPHRSGFTIPRRSAKPRRRMKRFDPTRRPTHLGFPFDVKEIK
jgi:hypothetical protein